MAKVTRTIHDTPTSEIIGEAAAEHKITDSKGREITLKKPGVLAQYRLVEVVGDSATNQVYMRMVMPLIYVTDIAGKRIFQPINKAELEAIIGQLDDHGIDAVMTGVLEHFGGRDPDKDKDALKK